MSEEEISINTSFLETSFSMLIFSLSSSVILNLGEAENPVTGKKEKNIEMAKQTMDMLDMLNEKTSGNLSKDETNLLEEVQHDLKMRYVKASA